MGGVDLWDAVSECPFLYISLLVILFLFIRLNVVLTNRFSLITKFRCIFSMWFDQAEIRGGSCLFIDIFIWVAASLLFVCFPLNMSPQSEMFRPVLPTSSFFVTDLTYLLNRPTSFFNRLSAHTLNDLIRLQYPLIGLRRKCVPLGSHLL